MKLNLFISFTHSQNNTISEIIKNNLVHGENYLLTSANNIPACIAKANSLYVIKYETVGSIIRNIIFKEQKRKTYSFINDRLSSCSTVEIIIPHFINLISNHIYTKRKKLFPKAEITFSIYPDGIALYFTQNAKFMSYRYSHYLSVLKRYIMGKIIGLQFTMFTGPIIDPFNNIVNIYTYFPSITPNYSSKKTILIPVDKMECKGENVLLLGGARKFIMNDEYILSLQKYISTTLTRNALVYYKPHPSIKSKTVTSLLLAKIQSLIIINDKSPVEDIISTYGVGTVVAISFFSTSLLHLKNIYKDTITCCIFKSESFIKDRRQADLVVLFKIMKELDIDLVKV